MSVTISTGITFASDDYLIPQGSSILQTPGRKHLHLYLVLKFLLTKLFFKLPFVKILMP